MTRKKSDAPDNNDPLSRLKRSTGYSHLAKGKSARPAIVLFSE